MALGWDEIQQSSLAGNDDHVEIVSVRGNKIIKRGGFFTYAKNTEVKGASNNIDTRMHYRRYYNQELENIKEIMPKPSPFNSYEIMRGQSRGIKSNSFLNLFTTHKEDDSGNISTETSVGKFKGLIQIQSVEQMKYFKREKADQISTVKKKLRQLAAKNKKPIVIENELIERLATREGRQKFEMQLEELGVSHLKLAEKICDLYSEDILKNLLLTQHDCVIRVHIISAFNLSSRDLFSESDPYLIVSCGNDVLNEKKDYQQDKASPDFYKTFEFNDTFPGCPPLSIKIMDFDYTSDELIGETKIDLEDRFFSVEWQSIKEKPIEYRDIYHPSSSVSQGTVKLWVEILPKNQKQMEHSIFDIKPQPSEDYEARVVIYETQDIKMMDIEGTSDVYIKGFFDSRYPKQTDVHYRCRDGCASFNYRLLFNLSYPQREKDDYRFNLQALDKDFMSSNDLIGDASLDLKLLIEDVALSKKPITLSKSYYESHYRDKAGVQLEYYDDNSFWVEVSAYDPSLRQRTINGKVRVEIIILPKILAEKNQVGEARQEPNHSPYLPPPAGRISFNWNPFKMMEQLFSKNLVGRIKFYLPLVCLMIICLLMMPMVIANIIAINITGRN